MRGPVEAGDRTDDPGRDSLRLLPSGSDRVGEGPVRRRAPVGTIPGDFLSVADCGNGGRYASLAAMRAPNFYSHPGFERAGLRRRDTTWILERIADPGSLFVPVWRNQNLVVELEGGEPRAAVLQSASISEIFGATQERLASGEMVFLGIIEERAHFALDLSPVEAPLDMLHSSALAASGVEAATVRFADLRQ